MIYSLAVGQDGRIRCRTVCGIFGAHPLGLRHVEQPYRADASLLLMRASSLAFLPVPASDRRRPWGRFRLVQSMGPKQ